MEPFTEDVEDLATLMQSLDSLIIDFHKEHPKITREQAFLSVTTWLIERGLEGLGPDQVLRDVLTVLGDSGRRYGIEADLMTRDHAAHKGEMSH